MNLPTVEECREFNLMITHVHTLSKRWWDIKLLEIKQLQGALLVIFAEEKKTDFKKWSSYWKNFCKNILHKNRLRHVKSLNSRLRCVLFSDQVKGIPGTYICNQYDVPDPMGNQVSERTFITFDKGGNWRLLEPPEELKSGCKDAQVSLRNNSK